jgi:hypothetical protein
MILCDSGSGIEDDAERKHESADQKIKEVGGLNQAWRGNSASRRGAIASSVASNAERFGQERT